MKTGLVTVDVVIFAALDAQLQVLLVERLDQTLVEM